MKKEFDWRDYDDYAKWLHDVLTTLYEENKDLRDEKVKLLSENQQLKKQKDDVVEFIHKELDRFDCEGSMSISMRISYFKEDLLRMLGEIDVKD